MFVRNSEENISFRGKAGGGARTILAETASLWAVFIV